MIFIFLSDLLCLIWLSLGLNMLLQMALLHSFLCWVAFHCMCVCTYTHLYPVIHQWLLLCLGGCKPCSFERCGAYIFSNQEFSSFPDICLRVGLQDGMVTPFLAFKGNHTIFHSFHQQCRRVPFSPHPLHHLLFVAFWWWLFWRVWGGTSL